MVFVGNEGANNSCLENIKIERAADENMHTALVCHPCITMLEKPLFGYDQNQQQMWTIEDQTWAQFEITL